MRLMIRNLKKRLSKRPVLEGIHLTCEPSEVVVVRGANGSGKSTLLSLIAGILEPDDGQVYIEGHALHARGRAARRHIGYVPDSTVPLPDLTVAELCALVSSLKQAPPPTPALIENLEVHPFFDQRLGTLSFGQRKRAVLLAALIGTPALLILDEPSNGLDPGGVTVICKLIFERRKNGLSTIVATNDEPFAQILSGSEYELRSGHLLPRPQPD